MDMTAAEYKAQLGDEWGKYVATEPIDINGARAFNVGDPVPVSHVTRGVVLAESVKTLSSQAGQAAIAQKTEN